MLASAAAPVPALLVNEAPGFTLARPAALSAGNIWQHSRGQGLEGPPQAGEAERCVAGHHSDHAKPTGRARAALLVQLYAQPRAATPLQGDLVSAEGRWEAPHTLQAAAVTVQQAWRDSYPLVSFTPQPSPLHEKREAPGAQHGGEQVSSSPQPATRAARQQGGAESWGSDQEQTSASLRTSPAAAVAAAATAAATAMRPTQSAEGPVLALEATPATAAAAARAAAERLAVCKFWVNTGRCAKGDACPHAHLQSGMLQQRWLNQM